MSGSAVERRLLQIVVALTCTVPLSAGILGVIESAGFVRGAPDLLPIDLDSHFRYLSGLLLGIGLLFLVSLPRIEIHGTLYRILGFIILVGGFSRLLSLVEHGPPGRGHVFGLVMELLVVPLIVLWQARIARRSRAAAMSRP